MENNIAITKKVVEDAEKKEIPVEAELGKVGGKEDDLEAEADMNTDPIEAKQFVDRTRVSSVGNCNWNGTWLLCGNTGIRQRESIRNKSLSIRSTRAPWGVWT